MQQRVELIDNPVTAKNRIEELQKEGWYVHTMNMGRGFWADDDEGTSLICFVVYRKKGKQEKQSESEPDLNVN